MPLPKALKVIRKCLPLMYIFSSAFSESSLAYLAVLSARLTMICSTAGRLVRSDALSDEGVESTFKVMPARSRMGMTFLTMFC